MMFTDMPLSASGCLYEVQKWEEYRVLKGYADVGEECTDGGGERDDVWERTSERFLLYW